MAELQLFYRPALPERFATQDAVKALPPNAPERTILAAIASAEPTGLAVREVGAKIFADTLLSPEGMKVACQTAFADTVEAAIKKFSPAIDLATKRADELASHMQRDALKSATVSDARGLALASWLRDQPVEARGRILLQAITDHDTETMAAALSAPQAWKVIPAEQYRDRIVEALIMAHDPARAGEIADFRNLVACAKETFESLIPFAREELRLAPPPAQPAKRASAAA